MKSLQVRKWLILPLEVVERELSGKMVVCHEALKRGWGCIIGTKQAINESIESLPAGAVLLKSVITSELEYMRSYKARGHKLACLDEEGLIQNNLDHMVSVRSTDETIGELEAFLFWGKAQCKAFEGRYPQHKNKYHVVSNPRADLWEKKKYRALYAEEEQKIRRQYGRYFIIPTSFGAYNHFMGKDGALSIYKVDKMVPDDYYTFLEGYRDYVKNIYYGFVDLIGPLSRTFSDMNIIIRPHPSENRKPWDKLARNLDNVHVVFSGSATPWLLGAEAVIHCGSTTAVEAHLLGRPVISYCRNFDDQTYSLEVPAKASINVTKESDVLEILEKVRAGEDVNAEYPEVAEGHEWLKNWIDGMDSYESASKIMEVMEILSIDPVAYEPEFIPAKSKSAFEQIKAFTWFILRPLEHCPIIKDLLPFRIKQGIRSRRYGRNKTKDINISDLKKILKQLIVINKTGSADIRVLRKNLIMVTTKA